ncbi:MAG: hypothetical protein NBV77_00200 [Bacteroidia bacterium]|nr:hypothetical protein [Bacteroidia bacterium]
MIKSYWILFLTIFSSCGFIKSKKEFNDPYYRTSSQSPKTINESAVNSELKLDNVFVEIGQSAISIAEKTTLKPQSFQPSKVSAKVKNIKYSNWEVARPEFSKRVYAKNSISDWFERFGAYNTLGEIGVWTMIVGAALLTFGFTLAGDNFNKWGGVDSFSVFQWSAVIGLGLLVLGFILWAIGLAIFHWF